MVDVLGLAQERRALLLREVETLDWFIEMARQLAEGPATSDLLLNRISLDTGVERAPEPAKPSEAPASKVTASDGPAKPPAGAVEGPADTLMFKRMLSEMRRKHQQRTYPEPEPEKIAASG